MNNSDNRDLTQKEINKLSPDLRACYEVQPWNIAAGIDSVDTWVHTFKFSWDSDDVSGVDNLLKAYYREARYWHALRALERIDESYSISHAKTIAYTAIRKTREINGKIN